MTQAELRKIADIEADDCIRRIETLTEEVIKTHISDSLVAFYNDGFRDGKLSK